MEYCVYCDESCHLEHDTIKPMVLVLYGALSRKEMKYLNALETYTPDSLVQKIMDTLP